jgi:hypothetical protein
MKRFVSAVNQPERVFLSSFDDTTIISDYNPTNPVASTTYNRFRLQMPTAILEPERCQLLRASIPNAQVSIPNYQLSFWYYRVNTVGPPVFELLNVRWFPDYWVGLTYGCPVNRLVANYADLLVLMNQAAAAADNGALNPNHVAGDITFAYDALTRKFSFSGNTAGYQYFQAGYADPAVLAAQQALRWGQAVPQAYVSQVLMNQRIGYCEAESFFGGVAVDPVPVGTPIVAPSWGDLVFTQNVILLANIIPGSSLGSGGQHNILSVVPLNAPPLGVGNFTAPMVNWMTKVMKEIYEIEITMLDDNYQPYNVPNNAIVNVELGFSYVKL